ncbi:uncharacterized protein LOC117103490 [Anneissia japonica]|uniref:uncharacterized protein LOC117103490 n=1 Tax=Anneissia japonica TaxID=1529436 RepID=UPI001425B4DE|nr:uncharacterized protein LOC117103490 [Anneissia japonica]
MEQWPKPFLSRNLERGDPEVKEVACAVTQQQDPVELFMQHYSSWYRLRKATAWLLRIKRALLKKEVIKGDITLAELKNAEVTLIGYVQSKQYVEEIKALTDGKLLKK